MNFSEQIAHYGENEIKKVYKQLRADIIEYAPLGGESQRIRLLLFGFLRGRSYGKIERKTQAQNYCIAGQETYYYALAYDIATDLRKRLGLEKIQRLSNTTEYKAIDSWMREHWCAISKEEEAA